MINLDWFLRNRADTDEGRDRTLTPITLSCSFAEAMARVQDAVGRLPRWRIETIDIAGGRVQATRTTRLCRFVDDIILRLESVPDGTLLHARSQARVGVGDFGQNRRNLLELFDALRDS
jgi:uncharacterized protein (DUF1499 family)